MKIFIDTANVEKIKKAAELGIISGVTTNPSLIAKEGRKFEDVIAEITEIVDGPICAEIISPVAFSFIYYIPGPFSHRLDFSNLYNKKYQNISLIR